MNRLLALVFVAGCAEEAAGPALPDHSCPQGAEQVVLSDGSFAWCAVTDGTTGARVAHGPWMTFHGKGKPASEGEFRDGRMLGPYRSWWPNGSPAAALDQPVGAGTLTLYDGYGKPTGVTIPYQDGVPRENAGHVALRTTYDDGAVESLSYKVDDASHGRFVAFHPDGRVWILGEFNQGGRHGPWLHFGKDGARVDEKGHPIADDAARLPALDRAALGS